MIDPTLEVQSAFVTTLKADADVAAIVAARVYDIPPPSPVKPYITIGEIQLLPNKADCLAGAELAVPVHGWSGTTSSVQVKQLGKAIIDALDDPAVLGLLGHRAVICELEQAQYLRDPDGITHHAVIVFHLLTEPTGDVVSGSGALVAQPSQV